MNLAAEFPSVDEDAYAMQYFHVLLEVLRLRMQNRSALRKEKARNIIPCPFSAGSLGKDSMIFEPMLCLKSENLATSSLYLAYHQESGSFPQFADHFAHFVGINRDDRISIANPLHLHHLVRSEPSKADRKFVVLASISLQFFSNFGQFNRNLLPSYFHGYLDGLPNILSCCFIEQSF